MKWLCLDCISARTQQYNRPCMSCCGYAKGSVPR